jgi:hypothetical protein
MLARRIARLGKWDSWADRAMLVKLLERFAQATATTIKNSGSLARD